MSEEPKIEYGWAAGGNDMAHGPFESEAAALADARKKYPSETSAFAILVGIIRYLNPANFLPSPEEMLEEMEERISSECGAEDSVVDAKDGYGEALNAMLQTWVLAYLSSTWWFLDGCEEVVLWPKSEGEEGGGE